MLRKKTTTFLLCFFLGLLGAHRFYSSKIGTGILMLLTAGGLGVWYLIDLVSIITGKFFKEEGEATLSPCPIRIKK